MIFNLPSDKYLSYLKSPQWERKRCEALVRSKYQCDKCGAKVSRIGRDQIEQLHVHHKTYVRLGHERLSDLLVLCRGCHYRQHKIAGQPLGEDEVEDVPVLPRVATELNPFAKLATRNQEIEQSVRPYKSNKKRLPAKVRAARRRKRNKRKRIAQQQAAS